MSRQGRMLTGQAVLSALILIVVYVALLRPEGGGSLSGVETPDGTLPPAGQGPGQQRVDRDQADSNARNRPARTTPGTLQTLPVPSSAPVTTIEQPTDDQYTDSLGKLQARLGAG